MKIGVDKNQFSGKHGPSNRKKHRQMESLGAEIVPLPLPFGDYCLIDDNVQAVIDEKGKKIAKKDFLGTVTLAIDTKKNIEEIWGNVCNKSHERFKKELLKPLQNHAKLVILIEHGEDIKCLEDVFFFYQPEQVRYKWVTKKDLCGNTVVLNGKPVKERISYMQQPIKGDSLYRALRTIRDRYNVRFEFCTREETGLKIMEILGNDQ